MTFAGQSFAFRFRMWDLSANMSDDARAAVVTWPAIPARRSIMTADVLERAGGAAAALRALHNNDSHRFPERAWWLLRYRLHGDHVMDVQVLLVRPRP